MLAPSTTAAADLATLTAPTVLGSRTAERARRRSGRHLTTRRVPVRREPAVTDAVLRRQVVNAINAGALDLEAGNELLTSLNQPPVAGGRQLCFSVDAGVRTPYDGFATMIGYARAAIVDELRLLRWTTLAAPPESYAIDEPGLDGPYGTLGGTVHTTLCLTVTVPAYPTHELEATARDLLYLDLGGLHRVEPDVTRISLWDEDVTTWDEYLVDVDLDDEAWPAVMG